ncbi:Metallo-dependent hydrolase [Sistotremastrum niveocremeum HHB9708]|uniref:Metallo-dependent hydrolase n=1 Tax=Sistotremastrum niveocremeum HHB9708 TaxID=1314777 RepID=A0A164NNU9_9AGAM|nr:Metallo-dependent hydrolase [Sistotremastrum niveocremeum HHB9708]
MPPILLKGGLVLTFKNDDPKPHAFEADVLVDNGTIVDIGTSLSLPGGDGEVVDCRGKWITPGQIDTHRHVWMSIMRAQQADWMLSEYLVKMTGTQAGHITVDEAYIGQLAGCLEAINAGVTTVVDHAHVINTPDHAPALIDATIKSGIRSKFCYTRGTAPSSISPWAYANDAEARVWQMKQIEELAQKDHGRLSDRVELGLAYDSYAPGHGPLQPHREVLSLARKYGLSPITTHYVGGPQQSFRHSIKDWDEAGLLAGDVLFSHANGLTHPRADPEEWELLKKYGASIGATPEDELGMAHGNPVAYEAVDRGADLFTQMRFALQWQRGHVNEVLAAQGKSPLFTPHSSASAFRLATLGGAEAIHKEASLGSIEKGKLADIVIIDAEDSINLAGAIDPFQALVFWAKSEDVESVIIAGEWVKRGRKLTKVDWKDVVGPLKEAVKKVEERRQQDGGNADYLQVNEEMGCATQ